MSEIDKLRQLISDVNDAALYDRSQLEERIDGLCYEVEYLTTVMKGLAARIDRIERKLNHKSIDSSGESLKIESTENGGGA